VGDFAATSAEPPATSASAPTEAWTAPTTNEDLGSDDGVVRAFDAAAHARCVTASGCICIHRAKAFPDLVVVATVRTGGCKLEGFFFRRAWYDLVGNDTRRVLTELGWDTATRSRRVDLAMGWTREVIFQFDGIVDEKPAAFALPVAPPFHPLEATWEPSGAIEVSVFVFAGESYGTVAYHEETVRFDPAGRVVKTGIGNFFTATVK